MLVVASCLACLLSSVPAQSPHWQQQPAAAAPNVSACVWQPVSATPILGLGSEFAGAAWNDPSSKMLQAAAGAAGATRVMYASAGLFGQQQQQQQQAKQPEQQPVKVYRLVSTSADPSTAADWHLDPPTPVLQPAAPYTGSETPDVAVTKDGTHHLFITTYQGPPPGAAANFSIGHAVSHDSGKSFTLLTSTLVVPTKKQLEFDGDIVGEPAPVVLPNGDLHLYFTAVGVSPGAKAAVQSIGVTVSKARATTASHPPTPTHPPTLAPRRYPQASQQNQSIIDLCCRALPTGRTTARPGLSPGRPLSLTSRCGRPAKATWATRHRLPQSPLTAPCTSSVTSPRKPLIPLTAPERIKELAAGGHPAQLVERRCVFRTGTSRQHCCRFCCMGAPAHCSDSFLHGAQSLCRRCNFSAGPEATACARVFQLDVARDPQPGADVHEEGRGGWWAHALALLRGGSAVHGGREWKARLPRRPLGDRRSNMRARITLTGVP